ESNGATLYVSPSILAEVRDVLTREEIHKKFPSLTPGRVTLFIQKVASMAVIVNELLDAGETIRDPKDLPYLNLAIGANVGYLVSWDNGLLELMKDASFITRHPQLRIVDP